MDQLSANNPTASGLILGPVIVSPFQNCQVLRFATALLVVFSLLSFMSGCGEESDSTEQGSGEPVVNANTFEIVHDAPGTPFDISDDVIKISNRMGLTLTSNIVHGLELTEDKPSKVIQGEMLVVGGGRYVKSRKLRIEQFMEPSGSRMVQVNVSLNSPLALKSLRGFSKDEFVPGPLLQDSIGNSYWPSGYVLKSESGENNTKIVLDRGHQFKNLQDLPRLSRNKPQTLKLLFFVNKGVTITSFSYGGDQPKYTFELKITDR